jgi:hypothetical protein
MKTAMTFLLTLFGLIANAHAITPSPFVLGDDPNDYVGHASCAVRANLQLDEGSVIGQIAYLENYVEGKCRLAIYKNPRYYKLTIVQEDVCGSVQYEGETVDSAGYTTHITLIDHRGRTCDDMTPSKIVVQETTAKSTQTMYSIEKAPIAHIDPVAVGPLVND